MWTHIHVTVRKCLVCLSEWVRTGHRKCYCLRGRSSSCFSWGCFLPSTHFPAVGRLGGISQTLCLYPLLVSSNCLLTLSWPGHKSKTHWATRGYEQKGLLLVVWLNPSFSKCQLLSLPVLLYSSPHRGVMWCQCEQSSCVACGQCSEAVILHLHGKCKLLKAKKKRETTWSYTNSGAV